MTDTDNNEKKPKQLLLTGQEPEDNLEANQSEKETNETTEEAKKASKLTFKMNYQQTAREKELFKRLSIILSLLALAIFITLYFISPFSKVGKIIVSGVEKSDATEIVNSSQLKVGSSLWEQYFNKADSTKQIVKKIRE